MQNDIELKKIKKLIEDEKEFSVKSYQRGYKWTSTEISELLSDINDFEISGNNFYCLQPVVIKRDDKNLWELIDGQQRITTIFIILSILNKPCYNINYETRPGSTTFLNDCVKTNSLKEYKSWNEFKKQNENFDNIDNYHFYQAYHIIFNWLNKLTDEEKNKFYEKIILKTEVIWYVVNNPKINAIDVFSRINSGKIPLTNAELIKALFLKKDSRIDNLRAFELKQNELAQEWDRIEYSFQEKSFWAFLNENPNKTIYYSRIDYLFRLIAEIDEINKPKIKEELDIYRYFAKRKESVEFQWNEVKKITETLKEWYAINETYHLIGYIISVKYSTVANLIKVYKTKSKIGFIDYLKELIKSKLDLTEDKLKNLDYKNSKKSKITQVLLLFNVVSILESNSNSRFPFDKYKEENEEKNKIWSIEHIHAQKSKKLTDKQDLDNWYLHYYHLLNQIIPNQKDADLDLYKKELSDWNNSNNKYTDEGKRIANELNKKLVNYLGDNIENEELNSIDNLALLDKNSNSSLGNKIFSEKRKLILEKDFKGEFIPMATKNVFLKSYSNELSQMNFWSKKDRSDYLGQIITSLKKHYLKLN